MQDSIATNQQATPPGQALVNTQNQHATNVWLSSVLSQRMTNEFRVAHQHLGNDSKPSDPKSLEIPSIEITELGLTGFNAGPEPDGPRPGGQHSAVSGTTIPINSRTP